MTPEKCIKVSSRKFETDFDRLLELVDTEGVVVYIYDHKTNKTSVMVPVGLYEEYYDKIIKDQ